MSGTLERAGTSVREPSCSRKEKGGGAVYRSQTLNSPRVLSFKVEAFSVHAREGRHPFGSSLSRGRTDFADSNCMNRMLGTGVPLLTALVEVRYSLQRLQVLYRRE